MGAMARRGGLDYSAIIAALLRVFVLVGGFPLVFRVTHMALKY
jgi:hypothetical protein